MKLKHLLLSVLCLPALVDAQKSKKYTLTSPDKKISVAVDAAQNISWSVKHQNTTVLTPSVLSLTLAGGEVLGRNAEVTNTKISSVNTTIVTPIYKKAFIVDNYNELQLTLKGNYSIVFRAYNDGVAYRFVINRNTDLTVASEEANFNFDNDYKVFIPYVREPRYNGDKFQTSFESLYNEQKISDFAKDTLAFLPVLVDVGNGKKVAILEADLENYPGMYLSSNTVNSNSYKGVFAPYPIEEKNSGYNSLNYIVTKRADYIAKISGKSSLPWRAIVISENDKELTNSDLVYKLASPNRLNDISWIKPGKVAWDWWNDWNITHVDFRAGINTPTYKYYIDFAAANKLDYIVMDEGWSVSNDMTKISNKIDLKEIIDYGKQKGVGVILWATWYALTRNIEEVFAKYSKMGIKGFKIDFFDRDDQKMVASTYEIARRAAEYKLMVDMHGMFKPGGLQRTYPNAVGFEGVRGMENVKWAPNDDVPRYDVTLPFIRMMSGAMDYTPGAMRNATKAAYRPINSNPMSQGTRCHQLAMYVVYEAPLQMLSDNPTAYMKEQESTDFIAKMPTVFDETFALEGKVGEYVAIARRKGDTWYVGAMSNWDARDLNLAFSFLGAGSYEAEIFRDGINADRDATDYKREVRKITSSDKITAKLMSGGGWAAIITKRK